MKLFLCIILLCKTFSGLSQNNSDTINCIDANGKKQGYWIVTGKNKPGSCFKANQKIEEGQYINNRKTGVWTEYYCNGFIKNTLTFVDGRPNGLAKMFYDNGQIDEVGYWRNNRWDGPSKKYTKEGKNITGNLKHRTTYTDSTFTPKK